MTILLVFKCGIDIMKQGLLVNKNTLRLGCNHVVGAGHVTKCDHMTLTLIELEIFTYDYITVMQVFRIQLKQCISMESCLCYNFVL